MPHQHEVRRGRPSLEEEGVRYQNIISAAKEAFAAKGYRKTNVSAIARTANVDRKLIYFYHGSKQGLYEAVEKELTS